MRKHSGLKFQRLVCRTEIEFVPLDLDNISLLAFQCYMLSPYVKGNKLIPKFLSSIFAETHKFGSIKA